MVTVKQNVTCETWVSPASCEMSGKHRAALKPDIGWESCGLGAALPADRKRTWWGSFLLLPCLTVPPIKHWLHRGGWWTHAEPTCSPRHTHTQQQTCLSDWGWMKMPGFGLPLQSRKRREITQLWKKRKKGKCVNFSVSRDKREKTQFAMAQSRKGDRDYSLESPILLFRLDGFFSPFLSRSCSPAGSSISISGSLSLCLQKQLCLKSI